MTGWPVSNSAALPRPCKCGGITGTISADNVICIGCGTKRVDPSATTKAFLADVTSNFGDPADAVIFRRPSAVAEIAKQDAFLKRKRRSDGTSWYDIVTENLDANYLGKEAEPEIAHDPTGSEQ
jgi:hypothetical protein